MTTHDEVATSPDVRAAIAGLCEVAGAIGDPHVRNRGTIGGSVANNDPAADYPAALLALSASIGTNKREITARRFLQRACSRPRSGMARSSRASPSPSRASSPTSSSPTRRRATRWSALRWPRPVPRSGSPLRAPAAAASSATRRWRPRSPSRLLGAIAGGRGDQRLRHDERHARRCRLSRPPRRRAGPPRSGEGGLTCRLGQA